MKKTLTRGAFLPLAIALVGCVTLAVTFASCEDTVASVKSGNKDIISFKIDNSAGAIKEGEITVVMPVGTDMTTLKPAIVVSQKATVFPASGAAVNFTNPTTYTVTAENGSSANFVVTVITAAQGGENNMTSFKIGDAVGAITSNAVSVIMPSGTDLASLSPAITVSSGATVSPASGAAVNFANPVTYTVTAENGTAKSYIVTVRAVTLDSISIVSNPYRTAYLKGTALDTTGLVVTGYYTDNSVRDVTAQAVISNYDKDTVGSQRVVVTVGGKTSYFTVTVSEASPLELTFGLVGNGNENIDVYGIPAGGIKLSMGKNKALPQSMVLSIGSKTGTGIYSSVAWYIDGSSYSSDNIITIHTVQSGRPIYTLTQPHNITIYVTQDNVQYSKTLEFTVEL